MSRLYYLAWLILAAGIFFPSLIFVLVNRQPMDLDLMVPGWQWQVPAGMALVLALLVGCALGLAAGLGFGLARSEAKGGEDSHEQS